MRTREERLSNRQLFISCIVPCYNEELCIKQFIQALTECLSTLTDYFEIILVDDGSSDHTSLFIQNLRGQYESGQVKALILSRRFGKEAALSAGLSVTKGEVTILIDADFQHPLALVPKFLERWQQGYDMVYGIQNDSDNQSWLRRQLGHLFYHLMRTMTQVPIPAHAGDFRLLDQCVVKALNLCGERGRFMKGLYAWVGFSHIGIPYTPKLRLEGKSKWRFSQLAELALTGLTAFSSVPLRVWGFIGFFISFLALMYGIYIIVATLLYGVDVPGFATIITAVMFLGGIQLLSIGILGEYISRIFDEVKQRPRYIVKQKLGFDIERTESALDSSLNGE